MKCFDVGEISLDWADDEVTKNLPKDAPILGILHSITGSSKDSRGFMHYAAKRGWRSCVLNRRGHSGMTLRVVPHFSIAGNVEDTALMIDTIRQHFPKNFIGLAGLSAGSMQLVSYIGKEGEKVMADAAASLCPTWDFRRWIKFLQEKVQGRLVSWMLTKNVKNLFLAPSKNQSALLRMPDVVEKAWTAENIEAWINVSAPLAGYKNFQHSVGENDPNQNFQGNRIPCLVLHSLDDPISPKECLRYDLVDHSMNYVLKVTNHGSHVAYNEGWFAQGNYMHRITLDFFESVIEERNSL